MKQLVQQIKTHEAQLKKLQRVMPPVISVILLLVATFKAAELSWLLFEPAPELLSRPVASTPVARNNNQNQLFQQKMAQLNNTHLFGVANAPLTQTAIKDAPETTLNLVLRGVLAANPMNLASAIIAQGKRGDEQIYGIGDSVSGATIEEIYPTHVILLRNGRHETLKLPEESVGETVSTPSSTSATGGINMNQTPDKVLGDIRRDLLKNPTSFGEYAIPVPVSKNGKLLGYRLRPQKKGRELFSQFGLERNDIVTQVNGTPLNDPVQAISALRKLTNATTVNLMVQRNGTEIPIQLNIR